MGVFEEIRKWLAPEIKELKAKLEHLESEVGSFRKETREEIKNLSERVSSLESLYVQMTGEIKSLKESQRKTEDKLEAISKKVSEIDILKENQLRMEEKIEEITRMLLEIVRLITKLEDKIELERRIERLEEAVLKKR
ncbi:MAG: hypothetical protein GXO18_00660 [Aquificae bacterium]|nr:hypothetical protein [Aquificota bacterium]